jgi:ABC-2 type transport system permease protein
VLITRRWAAFLVLVGVWTWLIWPRFGVAIYRYLSLRLRVTMAVLLTLSFVFLFLTNTRSAILGVAIGLIVAALVQRSPRMIAALCLTAVLGLLFLPAVILSGFMYPIHTMPVLFQKLTLLNPLRHFLEIVRAIFLKGAGFADIWPQLILISCMAVVLLFLASWRFRRTLL